MNIWANRGCLVQQAELGTKASLEAIVVDLEVLEGRSSEGRKGRGMTYFNEYILQAVEELHASWALKGYDRAVLTHDIAYGGGAAVRATKPPATMCVAAVMEVILTAMNLYAEEKGDDRIFSYLPKRSWERLAPDCIKAHLWVNPSLESYGAADALRHFGMGATVPFEELKPGSFIGVNRVSRTGHATVFLAFIDIDGNELSTYGDEVVGFKYFSSQGKKTPGAGGLDFRHAIFSTREFEKNGYPQMPIKRDVGVIRSSKQHVMNTGMMLHPDEWLLWRARDGRGLEMAGSSPKGGAEADALPDDEIDMAYFDGVTVDDDL